MAEKKHNKTLPDCTLNNRDLIKSCESIIQMLCKADIKPGTLRAQPDPNINPDILFSELIKRFKLVIEEICPSKFLEQLEVICNNHDKEYGEYPGVDLCGAAVYEYAVKSFVKTKSDTQIIPINNNRKCYKGTYWKSVGSFKNHLLYKNNHPNHKYCPKCGIELRTI